MKTYVTTIVTKPENLFLSWVLLAITHYSVLCQSSAQNSPQWTTSAIPIFLSFLRQKSLLLFSLKFKKTPAKLSPFSPQENLLLKDRKNPPGFLSHKSSLSKSNSYRTDTPYSKNPFQRQPRHPLSSCSWPAPPFLLFRYAPLLTEKSTFLLQLPQVSPLDCSSKSTI